MISKWSDSRHLQEGTAPTKHCPLKVKGLEKRREVKFSPLFREASRQERKPPGKSGMAMNDVGQHFILESHKQPLFQKFPCETWPTLQQEPRTGGGVCYGCPAGPQTRGIDQEPFFGTWPIFSLEGGESCLSGCSVGALVGTLALRCVELSGT